MRRAILAFAILDSLYRWGPVEVTGTRANVRRSLRIAAH
jgi:hypothetical protein